MASTSIQFGKQSSITPILGRRNSYSVSADPFYKDLNSQQIFKPLSAHMKWCKCLGDSPRIITSGGKEYVRINENLFNYTRAGFNKLDDFLVYLNSQTCILFKKERNDILISIDDILSSSQISWCSLSNENKQEKAYLIRDLSVPPEFKVLQNRVYLKEQISALLPHLNTRINQSYQQKAATQAAKIQLFSQIAASVDALLSRESFIPCPFF
jgi:hypothetical protein